MTDNSYKKPIAMKLDFTNIQPGMIIEAAREEEFNCTPPTENILYFMVTNIKTMSFFYDGKPALVYELYEMTSKTKMYFELYSRVVEEEEYCLFDWYYNKLADDIIVSYEPHVLSFRVVFLKTLV